MTISVLAGAALGLVSGFILEAAGLVDNPFWPCAAAVVAAAVCTQLWPRRTTR